MSILLDSREGSYQLARMEPLRSLLSACSICGGAGRVTRVGQPTGECSKCRGTGRLLSKIKTSKGEGGPDVLICGNGPSGPLLVAVEVKDIRDLIQSTDTGRLQAEGEGQLPAMLADYDQSWLLWYGTVRCGQDGNLEEPGGSGPNGRCLWRPFTKDGRGEGRPMTCDHFDSMLIAVAAMGVHVHHVGNERRAAEWLGSLYRYWSKPYVEHKFTHTFNAAPRFPKVIPGVTAQQLKRARRVFDRYTGLGMERALAAAKHFGSVKEMANADEKEWRKVPGIGKVLAAAMVEEFNS